MAKTKNNKTNALRELEQKKIPYRTLAYSCDGVNFDGERVADQVGLPPGQVFKTLITRDDKGKIVVCCIPVDGKLNLKALALAAGCKRLELIPTGELLTLTGYIRGGCSPVGMKKQYPTYLHQSALDWPEIAVSAGQRGLQMVLSSADLIRHTAAIVGSFLVQ